MALASQSSRSGSRRAYMTSRRRRGRGRLILALIMLAAIIGGGWWWFYGDRGTEESVEPVVTREPATSSIEMEPRKTPRRRSLDPVTGDRDLALGDRGSRAPESSKPATVDSARPPRPSEPVETIEAEPDPTPAATSVSPQPAPKVGEAARPAAPAKTESGSGSRISEAMAARTQATMQLAEAKKLAKQDPIEARRILSQAWTGGLSESDRKHAATLSRTLADRTLLLDPMVLGSPWTRTYTIRPSDTLGGIIFNQKVATSQSFIARINDLDDPNAIRANKPLLLPNGRFHAVVDLGSRDVAVFQELDDGRRDLLLVMPIALGPNLRAGLDPDRDRVTGLYRVRPQGMRRNPSWKDPATGKMWRRGDVGNPVGEHWISLEALEKLAPGEDSRPPVVLHGTSPDHSIETGRHPGLIAMEPADIEILYLMLDTGDSTVDVRR